jgi:hypothetical protein
MAGDKSRTKKPKQRVKRVPPWIWKAPIAPIRPLHPWVRGASELRNQR